MLRDGTPANRLASRLIPTLSRSMPSAEVRTRSTSSTSTTAAMTTGIGSPRTNPEPRNLNGGLVTVVICPCVMSIAIPRPATMRIIVAMKGWIPSTATMKPLNVPMTTATASAIPIAVTTVPTVPALDEPSRYVSETASEIAMTAPTERSMPPVEMTSAMPSPRSIGVALNRRMSMS